MHDRLACMVEEMGYRYTRCKRQKTYIYTSIWCYCQAAMDRLCVSAHSSVIYSTHRIDWKPSCFMSSQNMSASSFVPSASREELSSWLKGCKYPQRFAVLFYGKTQHLQGWISQNYLSFELSHSSNHVASFEDLSQNWDIIKFQELESCLKFSVKKNVMLQFSNLQFLYSFFVRKFKLIITCHFSVFSKLFHLEVSARFSLLHIKYVINFNNKKLP